MSSSKSSKKLKDKVLEDFLKRNKIAEGSICKFQDQITYTHNPSDEPLRRERIFQKTVYRISKIDNKNCKPPPKKEVKPESLEASLDQCELINEIDKNLKHLKGQKRFLQMAKENRHDKTWSEHLMANRPMKKKKDYNQNMFSQRPRGCETSGHVCDVIQKLFEKNRVKVADSSTQIESPIPRRKCSNREGNSSTQREWSRGTRDDYNCIVHGTKNFTQNVHLTSDGSSVNITWSDHKHVRSVKRTPIEMVSSSTQVGKSKLYPKKLSAKKKKVELGSDSGLSSPRINVRACKPTIFHAASRSTDRHDYCSDDSRERFQSVYMRSYKPSTNQKYAEKPRSSHAAKKHSETRVVYRRSPKKYASNEHTPRSRQTTKSPRTTKKTSPRTPRTSRKDSIENYLSRMPYRPKKLSEEIADDVSSPKNARGVRPRSKESRPSSSGEKSCPAATLSPNISARRKQSSCQYNTIYEPQNLRSESQGSIRSKTKSARSRQGEHSRAHRSPRQTYRISEKTIKVEESRRVVQKFNKDKRSHPDGEMAWKSNKSPTNNLSATSSSTRIRGFIVVKPNVIDDRTYVYPGNDETTDYVIHPYCHKPKEEEPTASTTVTYIEEYCKVQPTVGQVKPSQKVIEQSAVVLEDASSRESRLTATIPPQPKYPSIPSVIDERFDIKDTSDKPESSHQIRMSASVTSQSPTHEILYTLESSRYQRNASLSPQSYPEENAFQSQPSLPPTRASGPPQLGRQPQANASVSPQSIQLHHRRTVTAPELQKSEREKSNKPESSQRQKRTAQTPPGTSRGPKKNASESQRYANEMHKSKSSYQSHTSASTSPRRLAQERSYKSEPSFQSHTSASKTPRRLVQETSHNLETNGQSQMSASTTPYKSESSYQAQMNTSVPSHSHPYEMPYKPDLNLQLEMKASTPSRSPRIEMRETPFKQELSQTSLKDSSNLSPSYQYEMQEVAYRSKINNSSLKWQAEEMFHKSQSRSEPELTASGQNGQPQINASITPQAGPEKMSYRSEQRHQSQVDASVTPQPLPQGMCNHSESSCQPQMDDWTTPRRLAQAMSSRQHQMDDWTTPRRLVQEMSSCQPQMDNWTTPRWLAQEMSSRQHQMNDSTKPPCFSMPYESECCRQAQKKASTLPQWDAQEKSYKSETSCQPHTNASMTPHWLSQEISYKSESCRRPQIISSGPRQSCLKQISYRPKQGHQPRVNTSVTPHWFPNETKCSQAHVSIAPQLLSREFTYKPESSCHPQMHDSTTPHQLSNEMSYKSEWGHHPQMTTSTMREPLSPEMFCKSEPSRRPQNNASISPRWLGQEMSFESEPIRQPYKSASTTPQRIARKLSHKSESNRQPKIESSRQPQMGSSITHKWLPYESCREKHSPTLSQSYQYESQEASYRPNRTHGPKTIASTRGEMFHKSKSRSEPQLNPSSSPQAYPKEMSSKSRSKSQPEMKTSTSPSKMSYRSESRCQSQVSASFKVNQPTKSRSLQYERQTMFYEDEPNESTQNNSSTKCLSHKSRRQDTLYKSESTRDFRKKSPKYSRSKDRFSEPESAVESQRRTRKSEEYDVCFDLPDCISPVNFQSEHLNLKDVCNKSRSSHDPRISLLISSESPRLEKIEMNKSRSSHDPRISLLISSESPRLERIEMKSESGDSSGRSEKTDTAQGRCDGVKPEVCFAECKPKPMDRCFIQTRTRSCTSEINTSNSNFKHDRLSKSDMELKSYLPLPDFQLSIEEQITLDNPMDGSCPVDDIPCGTQIENVPTDGIDSELQKFMTFLQNRLRDCDEMVKKQLRDHEKKQRELCLQIEADQTGQGNSKPSTPVKTEIDCEEMFQQQLRDHEKRQMERCAPCTPPIERSSKSPTPVKTEIDAGEQHQDRTFLNLNQNKMEDLDLPLETDQMSESDQEHDESYHCCHCDEDQSSSDRSDIPPFTGCECMREGYYRIMRLAYNKEPK